MVHTGVPEKLNQKKGREKNSRNFKKIPDFFFLKLHTLYCSYLRISIHRD